MLALQFIFFNKVTKWSMLVFRFLWCSHTYKYIGKMFSGPFAILQPPLPSPHPFSASSFLKRQDLAVCPCSPGWPSTPAVSTSIVLGLQYRLPHPAHILNKSLLTHCHHLPLSQQGYAGTSLLLLTTQHSCSLPFLAVAVLFVPLP